jgi:NSS family neurotransmitter:Na+ symporter
MTQDTPTPTSAVRAQWGSKVGFVLAAAGSAVGLGNIWKFPYIAGENGGGLFVLVYLACVAFVGIPVLMAEVVLGRLGRASPVAAVRNVTRRGSPWIAFGWAGVIAAFMILSYYSVVAGWCLDYVWLSASGRLSDAAPEAIPGMFGELASDAGRNLLWHAVFMAATVAIVLRGVRGGVERASRILMPALFLTLIALLVYATTLDGFGDGLRFVFEPRRDRLDGSAILEALGHSFFSLSIGMGAMLTYGSYLSDRDPIPGSSIAIGVLDTAVALLACLVIFPITFTFGMEPTAGPGLVFQNLPVAFAQLPFGAAWATLFFVLLTFAALTSAISLLEVATAYFIDDWGLRRSRATLMTGAAIFVLGIPSALSGATAFFGADLAAATGRSWFDWFDYLTSNWILPLTGLGLSLLCAWRVGGEARRAAFTSGSALGRWTAFYLGWLMLLRFLVPIAIGAIFLHVIGII